MSLNGMVVHTHKHRGVKSGTNMYTNSLLCILYAK